MLIWSHIMTLIASDIFAFVCFWAWFS